MSELGDKKLVHVVGHDPIYHAADTKISVHSTIGEKVKPPIKPSGKPKIFLSINDPDADFHENSEYHKSFEV
jgi:hypothetical protein